MLLCCFVKTGSLHGEYKTNNVIVCCCLLLALLLGVCLLQLPLLFDMCWLLVVVVCCVLLCCCIVKTESLHVEYKTSNVTVGWCVLLARLFVVRVLLFAVLFAVW